VRRILDSCELHLPSWVISIDEGSLHSVSINLDGRPYHCGAEQERKDIERAFGKPRHSAPSGS